MVCSICKKDAPTAFSKHNADGSLIVRYCLECAADKLAEDEAKAK